MASAFQSCGFTTAPFEAVIFNKDLETRPSRPADYAAEVRVLSTLMGALADSPETILQALVDEMLALFAVHSAGISILTTINGEERFLWPAIAGEWKGFVGGGTPRAFGPCGDVIDRNRSFLFRDLELRYDYYQVALPKVEECILSPFYLEGNPVGTLWIVAHDKVRKFDAEDVRLLESVARFAATACYTVNALGDLRQKNERLEAASFRLEEANADLHHFTFAAGHDLREPLRAIRICAELLVDQKTTEKLTEEEMRWVHSIVDGSIRMDALISDLLMYAQSDEGDRGTSEPVKLNLVFDQAVSNLRTAIQESKATVTRDDLPEMRFHAGRFIQLIQNLIGNSINYKSDQPPVIHLAVQQEPGVCHFILSDNGVGIDARYHHNIFEAFKRLHGREISGTGLGLAICRRIVNQFGGKIWVESAPGEGARFHFTVPC